MNIVLWHAHLQAPVDNLVSLVALDCIDQQQHYIFRRIPLVASLSLLCLLLFIPVSAFSCGAQAWRIAPTPEKDYGRGNNSRSQPQGSGESDGSQDSSD